MSPIGFSNSINVVSLVGTWLGTLFTAIGLLAVLSQIRSLMKQIRDQNSQWKEKAAGAWASCILIDRQPSNGIQEGTMPKFSGWLQNFYLREEYITVSQDDRGSAGKSSWSDLFSRLDIDPVDLRKLGDVKPLPPPSRKGGELAKAVLVRTRRPGLADVLVDNGSISYGFSAAEFAALITLCGFRPEELATKPTSHSTSYFGQMQVAEHGQFSQIAKFDSHHGFRDSFGTYKTDMRDIPIAHCLNLAYGMIRTKGRFGREWIILPEPAPQDSSMRIWSGYPQPQQLKKIQYAFESFAGAGELHIDDHAYQRDDLDEQDVETMHNLLCVDDLKFIGELGMSRNGIPYPPAMKAREALNAAHAIAAIQPWALLPTLQC